LSRQKSSKEPNYKKILRYWDIKILRARNEN